jgi:hypothetical protein
MGILAALEATLRSSSWRCLRYRPGQAFPARNHPAYLQWREAFRSLWPCLHGAAPIRARLGHPRVEVVMVILMVRQDDDQTRTAGLDLSETCQGRHAIIQR